MNVPAQAMSPTTRRNLPTPLLAGMLFLLVQVIAAMVHAFSDDRLFDYTPYSGLTAYRLNVSVAGQPLTDQQVRARYGIAFRGRTALTPAAIQQLVVWREGASPDDTVVRLHVSRKRGPEQIWLWPQQ